MFIIAINHGMFGLPSEELNYLGWQHPAWDEDGYFWTSKDTIAEMIKKGNDPEGLPFIFKTEGQAKRVAKERDITDYIIVQWQMKE